MENSFRTADRAPTGDLMEPSITDRLTALAIPALAAVGGAAVVFSEFDDAPGGVLIGLLLIIGAVALSWRSARDGG
jgi:hypothetical protein